MKKIINKKLYNTDTAKEIAWKTNGYYTNDFHYMCETLYRKRTGEYFLHGTGNAMSKYAERHGNEICGSDKIFPFTEEQAKEWAERNLEADEYMHLFGSVEE